jgi:hypothetical protein
MRKVLLTLTVAAIGLFACDIAGTGHAKEKKKEKGAAKPPYVHAVIFYLKKDAPKDEVETLIDDSHKLLAKIPSVKGLWVGRPAEKSTPKFAVTDYQVGLLVLFDNADGLTEYLDHKLHLEYVEKHAKHFERVPVYDFINQKK